MDRPTLMRWYTLMSRIRVFEDRIHQLVEEDRLEGYVHTYAGEEASGVGVIAQLRDDDYLTSTYRNHGHAIARGVDLRGIAAEIYGKAAGVCGGKGGSMHVADQRLGMIGGFGLVAAGLPVACGAALASQYLGRDRVAVAFFGDGAVHEGAFHEAMDLAALWKLPVVFVCENNLYAETTAVDYHLNVHRIAEFARSYAMPGHTVDGMDIFAVAEVARDAIARARAGRGPTLIENMTYRYYGQYEGDTQLYKPPDEVAAFRARDPLALFRQRVTAEGWLAAADLDAIDGEARGEVEVALRYAEAAPFPEVTTLTQGVYTEATGRA
jgi:TPP-dependent pyruvate/acetoin dehydrogenase alpha subunit